MSPVLRLRAVYSLTGSAIAELRRRDNSLTEEQAARLVARAAVNSVRVAAGDRTAAEFAYNLADEMVQ